MAVAVNQSLASYLLDQFGSLDPSTICGHAKNYQHFLFWYEGIGSPVPDSEEKRQAVVLRYIIDTCRGTKCKTVPGNKRVSISWTTKVFGLDTPWNADFPDVENRCKAHCRTYNTKVRKRW